LHAELERGRPELLDEEALAEGLAGDLGGDVVVAEARLVGQREIEGEAAERGHGGAGLVYPLGRALLRLPPDRLCGRGARRGGGRWRAISRTMPLKCTARPGRYRPRSDSMKPRMRVAPPLRSSGTPKFQIWMPLAQLPSTTARSPAFSTTAIMRCER